jgi:membrane protease YdiL (CAAX protease family)
MMIDRARFRAAGIALLRVLLFVVLFAVLQIVLATLLRLLPFDPVMIDAFAVLAAAIILGVGLLRWLEHEPAAALGFPLTKKVGRQMFGGFGIGAAGLLVACVGLIAAGALRYQPDSGSFAQWTGGMANMLVMFLIPAAAEEALFRGYPFQKLVEGFGAVLATLGASALFAIAHAQNPSVNTFALVNIFVAGLVLSIAYLRTRSLWFATGVHLGWNWSMAALLDLPVSGLELFDAPLYEPSERGPAWLSGGAFGPEAGLAGLVGLLLVLAGVIWMTRKTRWVT